METEMKTLILSFLLACAALPAAAQQYNTVPSDDAQYRQCLSFAARRYDGGTERSPIRGQNKIQAWCTCLWNETPDNFRGNLVNFSESTRGERVNKICEKYADWG